MSNATTITSDAPSKRHAVAGWLWGTFVTLFLVGQIILGVSAVRLAASDGGEQPIAGAEEAISRSYAEDTDEQPEALVTAPVEDGS